MTIADDATCLQRVLKCSKNLIRSNFLDFFLGTDSRDKFQEFLAQETQEEAVEGRKGCRFEFRWTFFTPHSFAVEMVTSLLQQIHAIAAPRATGSC